MSNTTESVKNYFNSAQKFMDTWYNFLVSMLPAGDQVAQKAAKESKETMDDFFKQMADTAEQEISKQSEMSPEQIQQANIDALNEFEQAYQKANEYVMDMLEKEKQYMQSDQYLEDIKNNKSAAQKMYNSSLDGASKMLDSYSNLFNSMKN